MRLIAIRGRWARSSGGMRVIGANDLERPRACHADRGEVIFRPHEVAGAPLLVIITGAVGGLNRAGGAEEEATTFLRPGVARVGRDGSQRVCANNYRGPVQSDTLHDHRDAHSTAYAEGCDAIAGLAVPQHV